MNKCNIEEISSLNKKTILKNIRITVFLLFSCVFFLNAADNYAQTSDFYATINKSDFRESIMAISDDRSVESLISQPNQQLTVTGVVVDDAGIPIIGANIMEMNTSNGTITDIDGRFSLNVTPNSILQVTYVGYIQQEIRITQATSLNIVLSEDTELLEEVVVIGYGTQKKETLVGSITQSHREDLEQSGGVSNLAQALTGRLPGVLTITTTARPGDNDPQILIRGQSTWNNNQPLILVDGIERRMNDIDLSEVESISVLKDASATAVFGVKGAEGVILINTRRGKLGKPQLSVSANRSISFPGRMPERLDSYNSYLFQNNAIEYELPARDTGWQYYKPMAAIDRFKTPQAPGDEYIYPNVDWGDVMLRDFAISDRVNVNFTGGTNFAKYFASFAYTHEGDLLNSELTAGNNEYKSKYAYDRFNYRTNLDFNITKSTTFSVNLAGYMGVKHGTRIPYEHDLWRAFYDTPPSVFPVKHEDGSWGYTPLAQIHNNVALLNTGGVDKDRRTQVTTDFVLRQELDFILEGLSLQGSFSYDNELFSNSGNSGAGSLSKHIAEDGLVTYSPNKGVNEYDFVSRPSWKDSELIRGSDLNRSYRRMFYQIQANYERSFDLHDLSLTALMNREEYAIGSMFPRYREDWVGRLTYNYDGRYLFETNGAYNGSEKFGEGYRFGFFPSVAVGWLVSNEKFMESLTMLNRLKIRYSIGKIGSDSFNAPRWAYETSWGIDGGGNTFFGYPNPVTSPFTQYKQNVVGNPHLQWEVAVKRNLGFEVGVFNDLFQLNFDVFNEDRDKIFLSSGMRNIPAYFGANPVAANIGATETHGYEVELIFRKNVNRDLSVHASYSLTHAKNKVIYQEDPQSLPWYMKSEGFQMMQTKTNITTGLINNWDEVYAVPKGEANVNYRLPGDAIILDFNGDGVINAYDNAPYGFPSNPEYTYNFILGSDYKGFGVMLQFYGVFNTTRSNSISSITGHYPLSFDYIATDYWTPDNLDARWKAPRVSSTTANGSLNLLDGSFLRLKTAEVSYTMNNRLTDLLSLTSLKLFVNGNNLLFWSDLPEDRERSFQGYPTMRRINFGFSASF